MRGATRLELLKTLQTLAGTELQFVVGDAQTLRPISEITPWYQRIPVPADDLSSWTDENCAAAFQLLAENWWLVRDPPPATMAGGLPSELEGKPLCYASAFSVALSLISRISLNRDTFIQLVKRSTHFGVPKFWAGSPSKPRKTKRGNVLRALAELYPCGYPSTPAKKIADEINAWLVEHGEDRASDDTVERAMKIHRSQFPQN